MKRYHHLDALRAVAMLLGVGYHLETAYPRTAWPEASVAATSFDWFTTFTHTFRMPLFFLLAGFFAAFLLARGGVRAFVRHRTVRIAVPLAVGAVTLVPLSILLTTWANPRFGLPAPEVSLAALTHPWHLWFLEYLLILYAAFLLAKPLAARARGAADAAGDAVGRVLRSPWRLALLPVVGVVWLVPWPWNSTAPLSWVPDPAGLVYVGLFFAIGWAIYHRRELLDTLNGSPWLYAALALVASVGVAAVEDSATPSGERAVSWPPAGDEVVFYLFSALTCWCAIFAMFGLFERWFSRPRPSVRYLTDSAYWIYLVHPPLITLALALLIPAGAPFPVVILGVLIAVTVGSLVSYELGVRYTIVGRVLHGPRKRSKRAVPAVAEAGEAATAQPEQAVRQSAPA